MWTGVSVIMLLAGISGMAWWTPLHGHAALFGVYGMLGIGLMCLRVLIPGRPWKEGDAALV